jgi:hypothetical protein
LPALTSWAYEFELKRLEPAPQLSSNRLEFKVSVPTRGLPRTNAEPRMPGGVADSFASHAPDQLPLVAVQVSPAMMREPAVWNPACRAKRGGLEFCKMKAGDALQARVRGAEVWPLSVEAYHALGEAGLMPERTELLYGFVYHKMSKSPLHSFLVQWM